MIKVCFLFETNKDNSNNTNHHHVPHNADNFLKSR